MSFRHPILLTVNGVAPKSHSEYVAFLGGEKAKEIARNVQVRQFYGKVYVRVHDTDVLIFYPDGTFSASNDGFATVTTTDRLNQFGPRNVKFYHSGGNLFAENRGACPDHNTRHPVVVKGRIPFALKRQPVKAAKEAAAARKKNARRKARLAKATA